MLVRLVIKIIFHVLDALYFVGVLVVAETSDVGLVAQ